MEKETTTVLQSEESNQSQIQNPTELQMAIKFQNLSEPQANILMQ